MRRYLSLIFAFLISIPVFFLPSSAAAPALAAEAGAAFLDACGFTLSSAAIAETFPQAWAEYSSTPLSTYDDDVRVLASGDLSIGGVFWGALRGFIDWLRDDKGITNDTPSTPIIIGQNGYLTTDGLLMAEGQPFLVGSYGNVPVGTYMFAGGSSIVIEATSSGAYSVKFYSPASSTKPVASGTYSLSGGVTVWLIYTSTPTMSVYRSSGSPSHLISGTAGTAFFNGLGAATASGGLDVGAAGDIDVPLPREGQQDRDVVVVGGLGVGAGATAAEIAAAIQQGITAGTLTATATVTSQAGADTGINYGDADGYTVTGLDEVFPFCIPWDIARMISGFSVPAEAPIIELPFHLDSVGIREDIVIDFSDYSSVALVARRVELVAFCVGLAIATRRLIWG